MIPKTSLTSFFFTMIFGLLIISGCTYDDVDSLTCPELAEKLNLSLIDTNNPAGRMIINPANGGEVGGLLVNIRYNGIDLGYNSYTLEFQADAENSGELYLLTVSNDTIPYRAGEFYKFNLENINKDSMQLSGMFIDNDFNKLIKLSCD